MVDPLESDDGDPVLPPGPRRSTYTPPPAGAQYLPGSLTGEPGPAPAPSPLPVTEPEPQKILATETRPEREPDAEPARVVWRVESAERSAPAVATALPGIPVEQDAAAHTGLPGVPPPPARLSLSDDELAAVVDPAAAPPGSTAELIDLFEQQLTLRAEEAQRLSRWERVVRESGVPHADELVQSVRSSFTGIIDVVPPATGEDPWAHYPAPSAPPAASADDDAPLVLPPIEPVEPVDLSEPGEPAELDAPVEQSDAAPAAPTGQLLSEALAASPPPFGLVPSAVVPPPVDEATSRELAPELESPVAATIEPPLLVEPTTPVATPRSPDATALESTSPAAVAAAALGFDELVSASAPSAPAPAPAELGPITPASAGTGPSPSGVITGSPTTAAPHSGAIRAVPVSDSGAPTNPPALRVEASALEPTPVALRAGRSIRLFWLWFAVNASVVSTGLGGVLIGLGMSLRQAILSALVGVALSFLPLGLGTLAGKWSGQPTMVVSRATFGIVGNLLPAILAVVTRLLWSAILLGMLGAGVTAGLRSAGIAAGADPLAVSGALATVALVIAAVIAGFGYGMIAIVAAVASALAGSLVVLVIVLTSPALDMSAALAIPDGDWALVVTGAVIVFSLVGLAWANSSGDLARYQSKGTIGAGAVLFASLGATVPAFALIAWGAALASSDPALAGALASDPVGALAGVLPPALALPLVLAVAISLLAAASLALYSGGFALLTTGLRTSRPMAVLIGVVLTGAIAAPIVAGAPSLEVLLRDVLTSLAVPVAAWAGLFAAETMIRTRRVHSPSLLQSGGVYPPVRWVNTSMLVVASIVGWGFTSAQLTVLAGQGFLWRALGVGAPWAESDAGVLVALLIGLLTPLAAGIPAVRRLQEAEYEASRDS